MRNVCLLVGLLLLATVVFAVAAQDTAGFKQPVLIGRGGNIRWSPNGTKVAYFTDDWLVVADTGSITKSSRVGQFRFSKYCWASDSSFLGQEDYNNPPGTPWYSVNRIVEAYLNGTQREVARDSACFDCPDDGKIGWPMRLPDGTAGYTREWIKPAKGGSFIPLESLKSRKGASHWQTGRLTILHERTGRLLPWEMGDICLLDPEGRLVRQITFKQLFYFPELSPNGDLILASAPGGLAVLDTLGNVLWRAPEYSSDLPNDHAAYPGKAVWAPDGRWVAYVMTEEDGHMIFGGDVYIADVDGGTNARVTNTPTVNKSEVAWFPDGTKILFCTEDGAIWGLEVGQ